ncbi:Protein F14F9.5 [Aphelenchoides avenae]|nr:Protein F14F9.5 [Aphelenchus avenae]
MPVPAQVTERPLRVMSFNLWYSGKKVENGIEKIAKHIRIIDPDIVGLQEVHPEVVANLTELLGRQWSAVQHSNETYPDTAVLTKHKFVENSTAETKFTLGVSISIDDDVVVNVWNAHLFHRSYGPYAAFNRLVQNISQIMAGENPTKEKDGRVHNMEAMLEHEAFNNALNDVGHRPLLVLGDFNCPSHLDWTEKTKDQHGGWVVEWPATKMLMDKTGVKDSFREVYPDELEHPGATWSTVQKFYGPEWDYTIPEPQDRIDFIFYRGEKLTVKDSFNYEGSEPLKHVPDQWNNDYPSDHYAVITDFILKLK